jgi:hypothetical protein
MSAEFSYYSVIVDCFNTSDDTPSDESEYYYGNDEVKDGKDNAEYFVAIGKLCVDEFFHCFVSLSFGGSCPLSVYIISQVDSFVKGFFKVFFYFFERAFALSLLS